MNSCSASKRRRHGEPGPEAVRQKLSPQIAVKQAAVSPDRAGKFIINTRSVFTCDDGSGTFNVMTEGVGTAVTDDFATPKGSTQLLGGTGAFTGLTRHGSGTGSINFATGTATGTISGFVVGG